MRNNDLLKQANLTNADECSELQSVGYSVAFDLEREVKGWDIVENGTLYGVSSGFYFISALGPHCSLSRTSNFQLVNALEFSSISFKLKYKKNRNDSVASRGKLYFLTASDSIYNEVKSIEFDLKSDNKWHVYRVDLSSHSAWTGFISNLKLVFSIDGQFGDEIFLKYLKIQKTTFTRATLVDEVVNNTVVAENFDLESFNSPPQNFSILSSDSDRLVLVAVDPENLSNKVVLLKNSNGVQEGPIIVRELGTPTATGYFSCRFYATSSGGSIKLFKNLQANQPVFEIIVDTDGRLKYKSGSSYVNFEPLKTVSLNTWHELFITFDLNRQLLSVSLDGETLSSTIPYLFLGTISALSLGMRSIGGSLYIDDLMVVEESTVTAGCVGFGRHGFFEGGRLDFWKVDIVSGHNDSLAVNINGYGDVPIFLAPTAGADLHEVRNLLEKSLSSIDIGGYVNCQVHLFENRIRIYSGTFGFDSSVIIKKHSVSSLFEELGFNVGYSEVGRPHGAGISFPSSFKAKSIDLNSIRVSDNTTSLLQNPELPTVEIGAKLFGVSSRKNKLFGYNKTFVDFLHRATGDGVIKEVYFQGELYRSPEVKINGSSGVLIGDLFYTGEKNLLRKNVTNGDVIVLEKTDFEFNGRYSIKVFDSENGVIQVIGIQNTTTTLNIPFRVETLSKIKHFRPNFDGTLRLISEAIIGEKSGGVLYSRAGDSYKINTRLTVQRGDLLGIYNPQYIYIGKDINTSSEAFLLELNGDVSGSTISTSIPSGADIKGIGLYGRSTETSRRASYDVTFPVPLAIKQLKIKGNLPNRKVPYNLAAAVNNGFNLSVSITGTHTHVYEDINGIRNKIYHPNIGYNIAALTDGIKYAVNGVLGTFEQNDPLAVYFYISGDSEFAGYVFDASGKIIENSLEFPLSEWPSGGYYGNQYLQTEEYFEDPYSIQMTWNVPKEVYKYRIYFKEFPNADGYYLDWFDLVTRQFKPVGSGHDTTYTSVKLDDLTLNSADIVGEKDVNRHHFSYVFPLYQTTPNPKDLLDGFYFQAYQRFTVLEKEFTPVVTDKINWTCIFHESTKMSEIELFSVTEANEELSSVIDLYVSEDGIEYQLVEGRDLETGNLQFDIGRPIKFMRLIVEPDAGLILEKLEFVADQSLIGYNDSSVGMELDVLDLEHVRGSFSPARRVRISNHTGVTADVELSIETVELDKNVLLKTSLNSMAGIIEPEVGPTGQLYLEESTGLFNTVNVAVNAPAYGLKNLVVGKKYYTCTDFETESDSFLGSVDGNKWVSKFYNFPQAQIGVVFPGFSVRGEPPVITATPSPTLPIKAELQSTWVCTEGFNCFINALYDGRRARCAPLGSYIGIIDGNGRKITIEKERHYYQQGLSSIGSVFYRVFDTSVTGTIASIQTVKQFETPFGIPDDYIEYTLNVQRVKTIDTDLLRLSYVDPTNGNGKLEWGGLPYFEINLNILASPLVGPIRVVIGNNWNSSTGSSIGVPIEAPLARINKFSFGGESSYAYRYHKFSAPQLLGVQGECKESNIASSVEGEKLIAIDLDKPHSLELVQTYSLSGAELWNVSRVSYSNSDVSDPQAVRWGNSTMSNARWLLFSEPVTTQSGKLLDTLRVYPSLVYNPFMLPSNLEWEPLGTVITDGFASTAISQAEYPVVLVELENVFKVSSFRILDRKGLEFNNRTTFNGWTDSCFYSLSSSLEQDPKELLFDTWRTYSAIKEVQDAKWLAFKNDTFSLTSHTTAQYLATIEVSTIGNNSLGYGQAVDKVDVTEYWRWFDTGQELYTNITLLNESESTFEGLLFGAGSQYVGSLSPSLVFNEDTTDGVLRLNTTSGCFAWRRFGSVLPEVVSGGTIAFSGYLLPDNNEISYYLHPEEKSIDRIKIRLQENSTALPQSLVIQTLTGVDVSLDSGWATIYTENNLLKTISGEYSLNETPYIVNFETPVTCSGFRVSFSNFVEIGTSEKGYFVELAEVTAYTKQQTSDGGATNLYLSNDEDIKSGGIRSLKAAFKTSPDGTVRITTGKAIKLNSDPLWSINDFFSFYMKGVNLTALDLSRSFVRLGKDTTEYFQWSLGSITSTDDLTKQLLRFSDADFIDSTGLAPYEREAFSDRAWSIKEDYITYVEFEFKCLTPGQDVEVWLDAFGIERENFTFPGRAAGTLFMNNKEFLHFPISNLNMKRGFLEFTFTPAWDLGSLFEKVYTLFSIFNELDECFSAWYSTDLGLVFSFVSSSFRYKMFANKPSVIQNYKPVKFSLVWDAEAKSTIRYWLNDVEYESFNLQMPITATNNSYLFVGSTVPQNAAAVFASDMPGGGDLLLKVVPDISSITAGVENLVLSAAPIKISYEGLQTLKDKIYLSIDGINYYNGIHQVFPIVIPGILPDDGLEVWVKTLLPNNVKGMSREGSIKTRWRLRS